MIDDISAYIFARTTYDFLLFQFNALASGWLGRMLLWVHGIGSSLLTLHLVWLGYQLITGRASSSATGHVTDSLRAAVILGLAMGTTVGGATLFQWLGGDLVRAVAAVVHGGDGDVLGEIDRNFGYMQLAFSSIDAIIAPDAVIQAAKDRNMALVALGIGSPGLVGMAMLLMFHITLSLFVGLGPLFVLCLIWPRTRPLFDGWLLYGLGTMFSMATLAVMLEIALPMVGAVAVTFWTMTLTGASVEGVNSLALQQGGLGLILTTMIIGAPVIAARFFKATLGEFMPFSAFMNRMDDRKTAQSAYAGSSHAYTPERDHAPMPTHAHRVAAPAQAQADEVKQVADTRSFSERYPNATASLDNRGGAGDPVPENLAKMRDASRTTAPSLNTGLGDSIDRLAGLSPTLLQDIAQLQRQGWEIKVGAPDKGSMTVRGPYHPSIVIDGRWQGNDKETFRALVHEVGHARYQYKPDYSSREAYINDALCDEAAAMAKNIQIRREILESTNGKTDIGLNGTATNHEKYNAAYDRYLLDNDDQKLRASIGAIFGDNEYVSVRKDSKKSYREYYGEEYDVRYGR